MLVCWAEMKSKNAKNLNVSDSALKSSGPQVSPGRIERSQNQSSSQCLRFLIFQHGWRISQSCINVNMHDFLKKLLSTFFPEGLTVDRSSDDAVVEVNVNANVVPGASQSYTHVKLPCYHFKDTFMSFQFACVTRISVLDSSPRLTSHFWTMRHLCGNQ